MKKLLLLAAMLCFAGAQAQVLKPHLTAQSKKIPIPEYTTVNPEICDGVISMSYNYGSGLLYVKTDGTYLFGMDDKLTERNSYNSPCFSGGAKIASVAGVASIIHPDGTHLPIPTANTIVQISEFTEGFAVVRRGTFMGWTQSFIDKNGKAVLPALSSKGKGTLGDLNAYPVREGRRLYYNAALEKYGFADGAGKIMVTPQFEDARDYSDGMAAVKFNGKWGFIDLMGQQCVEFSYNLMPGRFSEGLAPVRIGTSESNYVMNYVDYTGKRVMPESQPWLLNEFHGGYAWVKKGERLVVVNKELQEVRDVTEAFYHEGNGYGVAMFTPMTGTTRQSWGIDFPGGMQALNQGGLAEGEIFAPDGTLLYTGRDADGARVLLGAPTEGGLMFCKTFMEGVLTQCFINNKGEIVYYFVDAFEGFE